MKANWLPIVRQERWTRSIHERMLSHRRGCEGKKGKLKLLVARGGRSVIVARGRGQSRG